MEFSLINRENLTPSIIENLKQFGFEKIDIDFRESLTFITIIDEEFTSYITRVFFEDKLEHCLHIYKMFEYGKSLNIPLRIIESVDTL